MGSIRFVLALSVIMAHTGGVWAISGVGGVLAVQSFYIISGFYMALVLNEKYIGRNASYKLFITNRLLKLYPVYWTVLFIIFISSHVIWVSVGIDISNVSLYDKYFTVLSPFSLLFLTFTNLSLFFQDMVMFMGIDIASGQLFFTANFWHTEPPLYQFLLIPQAWTIGLELMFYIVAPLIVKRSVWQIGILMILSLFIKVALIHNGLSNDPWNYRFFPTELFFFLLGAVVYNIYRYVRKLGIFTYNWLLWIGLMFLILLYDNFEIPYKSYIYLVFFCAFLPYIFIYTKNSKADIYLGELSYPMYVSHIFIFTCVKLTSMPLIYISVITMCATILFSIIINQLLVKKIELFRNQRLRQFS